MTRFLLVRHGETNWNVERRTQGHSDIPLNENGRQQAQAAAEKLRDEEIDAIYASDLGRAWETAKEISKFQGNILEKEVRFREMSFGEWEGLTYDEIQELKQIAPKDWNRIMVETGPPGGESLRQFSARIKEAIDEIIAKHPDDCVLIAAHSGTLMLFICLLLEHPIEKYWQFRLDRASISDISTYPDGAIICLLNDTSHLNT